MKKAVLSIAICFLIVIMGMIWILLESRNNQKIQSSNRIIQKNANPVTEMERRLGPDWKKIEMVPGSWYGPHPIKNGTKWRVAVGGITVRLNGKDNETYQEFPNSKIELNYGKKVDFSSTKKGTVMFFKY